MSLVMALLGWAACGGHDIFQVALGVVGHGTITYLDTGVTQTCDKSPDDHNTANAACTPAYSQFDGNVTAIPAADSVFDHWSGDFDCASTDASIKIHTAHTCTAVFVLKVPAATAVDDTVNVPANSGATTIAVLDNDMNPGGGPLLVIGTTPAANGTVGVFGGTAVTYMPTAGFVGTDRFTYTITGGSLAIVTVFVHAVNHPPVAVNDTPSTTQDVAADFDVCANDTDVDHDVLMPVMLTQPQNGTATVGFGKVHYVPAAGYIGSDSFTYFASDGMANSATPATVSIMVTPRSAQTITFNSMAPTAAVVGGSSYNVLVMASSGLPVALTIGAAASTVCSLSGSAVSFIGAGNCIIDANQAGDASFNPAPQVQQSFVVGKTDQAITFTSTAPIAMVGGTYPVTAVAAPSGLPVSFTIAAPATSVCSIAGSVVSFNAPGQCIIDANQPGNQTFNPAPQNLQSFPVSAVVIPPSTYLVISDSEGGVKLETVTMGGLVLDSSVLGSPLFPQAPSCVGTVMGNFCYFATFSDNVIYIEQLTAMSTFVAASPASTTIAGAQSILGGVVAPKTGTHNPLLFYAGNVSATMGALFPLTVADNGVIMSHPLPSSPAPPVPLTGLPTLNGIAIDPAGGFLYVSIKDGTLDQLAIGTDGTATPLAPAAVVVGGPPASNTFGPVIRVSPDGASVYATDPTDKYIAQYIKRADGTLAPQLAPTFATAIAPADVALVKLGSSTFGFVLQSDDMTGIHALEQVSIDANGGLVAGMTVSLPGTNCFHMAVDNSNNLLFVTCVGNVGGGEIYAFAIAANGSLTSTSWSPVTDASGPAELTVFTIP